MLAKLLKTEFSATARVHLILIAASLGLTLFTSLSMLAVGAFSDNMATLMLVTGPAYLLSSIIMPVTLSFPILHAAWRFYKNLAGDEGYLMHMLPVPTGFLVLSKAIVACLWTLASSVIGLVGYFV
ncbi:MAG: ABC transporter permease, partial [Clostridia bacterium]|nr:ABC transporter permease [Clostridia bacterium]